jgi:GDP/UDP-N,N'-diacetylbacillosamine 2-epimerase (hydrolysing)
MPRRISYISGTRADFGLMHSTLHRIAKVCDLSVIATGMHLSASHGMTVDEITAAGFRIADRIAVAMEPATGATMARGIATMIEGFVSVFETERPEIVVLLGDRGEMLAAAIAAIHLNIAIAHIAGGERSGTVDEPVRHAVSKLSHIHFTSTIGARNRLVAMGENPAHVHVSGAPGIDGLADEARASRADVAARYGFDPQRQMALLVFHPVLQEADRAGDHARALISALAAARVQIIALMPNADAGSEGVRAVMDDIQGNVDISVQTHLSRPMFLDAMANCDVMIGNSSAGIIEAGSFGTPVINVGVRQNLRERNANVIDVLTTDGVELALAQALSLPRGATNNIYGDGHAGERIAARLAHYPLDADLLAKANFY